MADLLCNARNCGYNRDEYCCKGDIMVGGKHAKNEDDTCCESFIARRGESITSACSHPSRMISIDCEVSQCLYNNNYKCIAEHVDIRGMDALDSDSTVCATFKQKNK